MGRWMAPGLGGMAKGGNDGQEGPSVSLLDGMMDSSVRAA